MTRNRKRTKISGRKITKCCIIFQVDAEDDWICLDHIQLWQKMQRRQWKWIVCIAKTVILLMDWLSHDGYIISHCRCWKCKLPRDYRIHKEKKKQFELHSWKPMDSCQINMQLPNHLLLTYSIVWTQPHMCIAVTCTTLSCKCWNIRGYFHITSKASILLEAWN